MATPTRPKNFTDVASVAALNAFLLTDAAAPHVLLFGAEWDAASRAGGAMDALLSALAALHPGARFARVDAEAEAAAGAADATGGRDVAEQFEVAAVPTVLLFRAKALVERLEGADAAAVTQAVEKLARVAAAAAASAAASGAGAAAPGAAVPRSLVELDAELTRLVTAAPVMAMIKGTPSEPRCKFSRQLLEVLRAQGVAFGTFDILTNEAVRQGLKDKFNWPTFPQLFVAGRLVGGIDIVNEMKANGELDALLPRPAAAAALPAAPGAAAAPAAAPAAAVSAVSAASLEALVSRAGAVACIKGRVEAPSCGYSAALVELLRAAGVDFETVDVLADGNGAVREALKAHFGFSTYPQLWVRGALVGNLETLEKLAAQPHVGGAAGLAAALGAPTREPVQEKLLRLSRQRPVVLFMKGSADAPQCGFSARAVQVLRAVGVDPGDAARFASVDILRDPDVRSGMKAFSSWPTFPQLYVDGTFVGGLDIMQEMQAEGELQALLEATAKGSIAAAAAAAKA
jgi:Grx4 family monothiol glutaredoxin